MRFSSAVMLVVSGMALSACGDATEMVSLSGANNVSSVTALCGLACPTVVVPPTTPPTGTGTTTGASGQALPPIGNGGNTSQLATAKRSILLETGILINAKDAPGLAEVTPGTTASTRIARIDTRSSRNSSWPAPKEMDIYNFGTSIGGIELEAVSYGEYRKLTSAGDTLTADEELQLWNWGNSYGAQYRNVSGGEARHQAWIFGGNQTTAANMPVNGTATLNGKYTGTVKTSNFIDSKDINQTLSYNGIFSVRGSSEATVNFGTSTVDVTLTPEIWRGWQNMNGAEEGFIDVDVSQNIPNVLPITMRQQILIKGTFGTAATTTGLTASDITGSANLGDANSAWLTNTTSNPVYGAFFGPTANEITGAYNVEGVIPAPYGGDIAINDDRRAFMQQSGVFHVE